MSLAIIYWKVAEFFLLMDQSKALDEILIFLFLKQIQYCTLLLNELTFWLDGMAVYKDNVQQKSNHYFIDS